jgi:hypothetical protein
MGVKFIVTDDNDGSVKFETSDWDAVSVALDHERKTERSNRLIARAKQSADSLDKLTRRLEGMQAEHGKILDKLAENLPAGMAVSFDDNGTPVALVPVEPTESAS